jgi:hypothetical protein
MLLAMVKHQTFLFHFLFSGGEGKTMDSTYFTQNIINPLAELYDRENRQTHQRKVIFESDQELSQWPFPANDLYRLLPNGYGG